MHPLHPRRLFPWSLVVFRAALGPLLIVFQLTVGNGMALAALVIAGLASDILDGVLARRWKTDTDSLRLWDSMADIVFYLGAAVAFALQCPEMWDLCRVWVGLMLLLEILRFGADILRFRRPSSYHALLSKLAGLMLSVGVVFSLVASEAPDALSPLATATLILGLGLGIASQLEGLLMTFLLPHWQRDVRSITVAVQIRRHHRSLSA